MTNLTPFQAAYARWNDAFEKMRNFDEQLERDEAKWLAANPSPVKYCMINVAERDEALSGGNTGLRSVPHLRLSSNPSHANKSDLPEFDAATAQQEWVLKRRPIIIVDDGERWVKHTNPLDDSGAGHMPPHIAELLDHSAQNAAEFAVKRAESERLWEVWWDTKIEVLKTPADTLAELACRIELYALTYLTDGFIGWSSIRVSLREDIDRLMGPLPIDAVMQDLRRVAAENERDDICEDVLSARALGERISEERRERELAA